LFFRKARFLKNLSVAELAVEEPSVAFLIYKRMIQTGHGVVQKVWKRISPQVEILRRATVMALSRVLLWLVRKLSAMRDSLRGRAPITRRETTSGFLQDLSAHTTKSHHGAIHG
jgi:hypothetical protein